MRAATRLGLALGVLCMAVISAAPAHAAAGGGTLTELTVQTTEHMAGTAIPPRTFTRRVCMSGGDFDPHALAAMQAKAGCRITNYRRDGDVVTFDEACSGAETVTSHGVFHLTSAHDFTGHMRTQASVAGRAITVDSDYTGRAIGACTGKSGTP